MTAIFPPVASGTRVARRASTTASGSTSHIIDTGLSIFAADYWNGNLIAMRSGSARGAARTITDFDGTKILTVSPALPASPGTSEVYEIFTDKDDDADVHLIVADIGDPSADGTTLFDSIKYLYQQDSGASMASVATDSILSHILAVDGDVADYDDTTDSLEAISNKVGAYSGDGGAEQDDSVKASLDLVHDELDAQLDIARSASSASLATLDGSEQTLYEDSDTVPYFFGGGAVDLTQMADTREVVFKIYAKVKSGGSYIKMSSDAANTYTGAQDPDLIMFDGFYNVYGVKVTIDQTVAGAGYIAVDHEWFDGKST